MPSAPAAAVLPIYCCYPVSNHFLRFQNLRRQKKPNSASLATNQIHAKNFSSLTLPTANRFGKKQEETLKTDDKIRPDLNHIFLDPFYSSINTNKLNNQVPETQNQKNKEETRYRDENYEVPFTNMWWADLKAALGQRINVEGIASSIMVFVKDRHLALPHVTVPDIRYVDWAELQRRGFRGVVFDKDNTITAPYSLTLWGPLSSSIERCKSVFGQDIAVFSNSAGLYEYDHEGSKARKLEGKVGIKVIRHRVKKPAGTSEEIEKHFGCCSSQLIMVGDRPFTDIVYGNRNGFLTILTEPLSSAEEPFIVRQVRKLELALVNRWFGKGLKPVSHSLLPDPMQCVKDPHPL